eukprot:12930340-Alexandrium_andersonii.AAC.1
MSCSPAAVDRAAKNYWGRIYAGNLGEGVDRWAHAVDFVRQYSHAIPRREAVVLPRLRASRVQAIFA